MVLDVLAGRAVEHDLHDTSTESAAQTGGYCVTGVMASP
jgi:hypothetical protein